MYRGLSNPNNGNSLAEPGSAGTFPHTLNTQILWRSPSAGQDLALGGSFEAVSESLSSKLYNSSLQLQKKVLMSLTFR